VLLQTHSGIPPDERTKSLTALIECIDPSEDTHTYAAALAFSLAVDADSMQDLSAQIHALCRELARLVNRPETADIEDYLALSGVSLESKPYDYDLDEDEAGAVLDILTSHVDPEALIPAITDAMMSITERSEAGLAVDLGARHLIDALHRSLVAHDSDLDPASADESISELATVLSDYLGHPGEPTASQIKALGILSRVGHNDAE
jgi:hypothetical protein